MAEDPRDEALKELFAKKRGILSRALAAAEKEISEKESKQTTEGNSAGTRRGTKKP